MKKTILVILAAILMLFASCSPDPKPVAPTAEESAAVVALMRASMQYAYENSDLGTLMDGNVPTDPEELKQLLESLSNLDVQVKGPFTAEGVTLNSGTVKYSMKVNDSNDSLEVSVSMSVNVNGDYNGKNYDLDVSSSGSGSFGDLVDGSALTNQKISVKLDGKLLDATAIDFS